MHLDAVVVGAGFSGMYMLYKLNQLNLKAIAIEEAKDVGGVWYWNRYPGARCDSESYHYNFTFSEDLYTKWTWSSKYPEQKEILNYLQFVSRELAIRKQIKFSTKVNTASYNETANEWLVELNNGEKLSCRYFITAVGSISKAFIPNYKGLDDFQGEYHHTGNWVDKKVDFKNKRVAVIGTGSSGVQSIPVIAKDAKELYVFQRTPNYILPANNYKYTKEEQEYYRKSYHDIRKAIIESKGGTPYKARTIPAKNDTPEHRQEVLEDAWRRGGLFPTNYSYFDLTVDPESNQYVADFVKQKMIEKIKKPEIMEDLLPTHYYNTKRTVVDTNYFETLNLPHVHLKNIRKYPIKHFTETGVQLDNEHLELDIVVFATGYDGITGNLLNINIVGKESKTLSEKWGNGNKTRTYLGMTANGFPNMFFVTGPQSPAVLTNVPASIEQSVEWISDCIHYLEENNLSYIEPTLESVNEWTEICFELSKNTLYSKTDSWYTGANIPGKSKNIQIYLGGLKNYRDACQQVAGKDYVGFVKKSCSVSNK